MRIVLVSLMRKKCQRFVKATVMCMAMVQHNPAYSETCADAVLFLRDSFTATVKMDSLTPNALIQEIQLRQACLTTQNFQNNLLAYFPGLQECRGVSGSNLAQLNKLLGEAQAFELLTHSKEIVAKLQDEPSLVYRIGNPLGAGFSPQANGSLNECSNSDELIFGSGFESVLDG